MNCHPNIPQAAMVVLFIAVLFTLAITADPAERTLSRVIRNFVFTYTTGALVLSFVLGFSCVMQKLE